jgi:hypothetical protein
MSSGPTFEEYLTSKKIDSARFMESEPNVWHAWQEEFSQMHPNSFTVQKLNLINPIRRKYQLPQETEAKKTEPVIPDTPVKKPGKPVIRPKLG